MSSDKCNDNHLGYDWILLLLGRCFSCNTFFAIPAKRYTIQLYLDAILCFKIVVCISGNRISLKSKTNKYKICRICNFT